MKKIENSPFDPLVKWFFPKLVPFVPEWLSANKISAIGFAGSIMAAICLYLSKYNAIFCLAGAFGIWLHWFADTLDGVVARARKPSILGYYLDHFGDATSVAIISIGIFLTPGSHLMIGLCAATLYLLLFIHGLIKSEITRTMELPAFGPTEIHFLVIIILIAQYNLQFGEAILKNSPLTGTHGWLAQNFHLEGGLTLIDHLGLFVGVALLAALVIESVVFIKQLAKQNRAPPDA
ncbi:MAG: CDP-alcohol phosphatidyltransferase family protein [Proteobacteria bacterium]|jgi:phosphatidylglycerophosphate synthase|nr:CDP-alcohol phosphatidyltransferase family protein [Pseudomonadota bacterium]